MGRQARCDAKIDGALVSGTALLEETELIFRPDPAPGARARRIRVPFSGASAWTARRGALCIEHEGRALELSIGAELAAAWIAKAKSPPSLAKKLGIARGARVHVVRVTDASLDAELQALEVVRATRMSAKVDVVLLGVETSAQLTDIAKTEKTLRDDALLWVVWIKGRRELGENHVREAALAARLVDVKVARVSDTLSGLKLVRRKKDRA